MSDVKYSPYKSYRTSNIGWIDEIPEGWQEEPLFTQCVPNESDNKGMIEDNLLSLSYGRIIRKNIETADGLLPASFETYQIVEKDNIVFRLTDLQNDKRSLRSAICRERGIITSAYLAVNPTAIDANYFSYLMRSYDHTKVFYALGSGLRQSLKYSDMKRLPLLAPPIAQQKKIAAFLDYETAKIDALIEKQQQLIALLGEKRQAVISHAVTKGLNPDVPMRDSGVEWLGAVPEHWNVKKLRYFAQILRGKFTHRPRNDPAFYDGDFPFVQTGDITGAGKCITQYQQTLNARGVSVSKQFPKGTLVMAIAANIGDVAILDFPAYFPDSIVGFAPNSTADVNFMYYMIQAMKQSMIRRATISTQMNLNVDQISWLTAACPPINEQEEIARELDTQLKRMEKLHSKMREKISLSTERRTALISAVVTGKIDVRNWKPPTDDKPQKPKKEAA